VDKTTVIYVTFLHDVACQKLLKLGNFSQSYSKNNTGTVSLRHGVYGRPLLKLKSRLTQVTFRILLMVGFWNAS